MRSLLSVLLLFFVLFFSEIDASGHLKRIFTRKKSSDDDEKARDISLHATPRLTAPWVPPHHPNSIGYEALDLQSSSSKSMIQNNHFRYQGYSEQQNNNLLIPNIPNRASSEPERGDDASGSYDFNQNPYDGVSTEIIKMPSMRSRRTRIKNTDPNEVTKDSLHERKALGEFVRGPMVTCPFFPPGPGSVDLFNKYYGKKSKLPDEAEKKALDLYERYQNRHVPDLNIRTDTEEKWEDKKSKRKL